MRVARNAGCAASSVSVGTRWPTGWKKKGDELPAFETSVAPAQKGDVLEADEMWSFVLKKSRKRWIWLVLCRRTRQIVAYAVGGRCRKTCQLVWSRIPQGCRYKRCFTDFYEVYCTVVPARHHRACGKRKARPRSISAGCIRENGWARGVLGNGIIRVQAQQQADRRVSDTALGVCTTSTPPGLSSVRKN
jgi:IS1 family transposase